MSSLAISEEVRTLPGSRLRPRWAMAGVAATILVDAVAGFLGWELVQPGETLIGPVSLVALIMALTGTAWSYALKLVGGWRSHRWLWFSVVALCLVPLLWTYFGILPSSLRWDTTGPATVQQILTSATLGCREVDTGSVGLLNAPYEVCATTTSVGYDIEFETLDQTRGYAYIQHGQTRRVVSRSVRASSLRSLVGIQ